MPEPRSPYKACKVCGDELDIVYMTRDGDEFLCPECARGDTREPLDGSGTSADPALTNYMGRG